MKTVFFHQGKEFTRTEYVRNPRVIEAYIKIRQQKDDAWIKNFAAMDEAVKEEMKKEKRRLQEQLRRLKRNQEKEKQGLAKPLTKKQLAARERLRQKQENLRMKCGACGEMGHMRTNKCCPMFVEEEQLAPIGPMKVAMTEQVILEE